MGRDERGRTDPERGAMSRGSPYTGPEAISGATPYPELNAVLVRLVAGVKEALGDTFVGAYLQGSFAVGDFDQHSDVDFITVAADELSENTVESLQVVHGRTYDLPSEWAKHLEGSYFPAETLGNLDACGIPLWYLDHGSRHLVLSDHCNTLVVRWTLREHGVVLDGPDPATLVGPVPVALLRREMSQTMIDWGREILAEPGRFGNRFYQSFIVLSYCRMLHDLHTGRVGSKRAGARWALETLDGSWGQLIDRAWDGRPDPAASVRQPADPADFARTLEFVRYAMKLQERILVRRGGQDGVSRET
jgi:hypothetical protein